MIAAQTATLGGSALAPIQLGGMQEYTAPVVDLRRREPDRDESVIFLIAVLAYAYAAYMASKGHVCDVSIGFHWFQPYWEVDCT